MSKAGIGRDDAFPDFSPTAFTPTLNAGLGLVREVVSRVTLTLLVDAKRKAEGVLAQRVHLATTADVDGPCDTIIM